MKLSQQIAKIHALKSSFRFRLAAICALRPVSVNGKRPIVATTRRKARFSVPAADSGYGFGDRFHG